MLRSYGDRPTTDTRRRHFRPPARMAGWSLPDGGRQEKKAIALDRVRLINRPPGGSAAGRIRPAASGPGARQTKPPVHRRRVPILKRRAFGVRHAIRPPNTKGTRAANLTGRVWWAPPRSQVFQARKRTAKTRRPALSPGWPETRTAKLAYQPGGFERWRCRRQGLRPPGRTPPGERLQGVRLHKKGPPELARPWG